MAFILASARKKGNRPPRTKLNREKVLAILNDVGRTPESLEEIGRRFGVGRQAVANIRDGLTWRDVFLEFHVTTS